MSNKVLGDHRFNFTSHNSGEAFILKTVFYANGDPGGVFTNHELCLNSYGNSALINLANVGLTPKKLRQLADELEVAMAEAKALT